MISIATIQAETASPRMAAMVGSSALLAAMVDASNRACTPLCALLGSNPKPTVARIKRSTARWFKIDFNEMVSARRAREVARPRQVAMYLARNLTPKSLPDIGRLFGDRDHTTVIHAVHTIEALIPIDPDIARAVEELTAELTA